MCERRNKMDDVKFETNPPHPRTLHPSRWANELLHGIVVDHVYSPSPSPRFSQEKEMTTIFSWLNIYFCYFQQHYLHSSCFLSNFNFTQIKPNTGNVSQERHSDVDHVICRAVPFASSQPHSPKPLSMHFACKVFRFFLNHVSVLAIGMAATWLSSDTFSSAAAAAVDIVFCDFSPVI